MITPQDVTWRSENEAVHVARHGIPFETAARAFLDPHRREIAAKPGRHGDRRYKIVATIDGLPIAVVFAMKEDVAHIVSARRASRRERR